MSQPPHGHRLSLLVTDTHEAKHKMFQVQSPGEDPGKVSGSQLEARHTWDMVGVSHGDQEQEGSEALAEILQCLLQ